MKSHEHEVCDIHFANLAALRTQVSGMWSDYGAGRVVSKGDIAAFGLLTQNEQWIHTDAARSRKESPYGDIIAHGLLILGLIPSLLPRESFQVVGYRQRIVRGCNVFRFPAPVYPGERVSARAKLLSVAGAASGKGTILTRAIEVKVEDRHVPAVTAELLLQYF